MFMRPPKLLLKTGGGCSLDSERLLDLIGEQRQRFISLVQWFGPEEWAAPTRCASWSAHDVVRHLGDEAATARIGADDHAMDMAAGFDPRVTPQRRLAASAGEPPDASVLRLVAATDEQLVVFRTRMAQGNTFDVHLPYGAMDWTVLALHALWDSWIHERDVLLVRAVEHPTDADTTFYVAAYAVFLAAVMAPIFGSDDVNERLVLGGAGGGVFVVETRGDVALTAEQMTTDGPAAADVADALAGRSPVDAVLGDLPANSRAALSRLADYFNTPVTQGPA
jgi:hypothetical protein